jgi:hypothetical protein
VVIAVSGAAKMGGLAATDSRGNLYATFGVEPIAGLSAAILYKKISVALVAGDTVTITLTNAGVDATGVMANFTGLTGTIDKQLTRQVIYLPGSESTAVSIGPLASLASVPQLIVALVGAAGTPTAQTFAPGSSFTEFVEGTASTVPACDAAVHYRIDSASPSIIAAHEWRSSVETTPSGNATVVAGSAAVTGTGAFTTHAPGDLIRIGTETRTISSITDNSNLTTTDPWEASATAQPFNIRVGPRIITATISGNIFKSKPSSLTLHDLDATTLASGLSLSARPGRFIQCGKEVTANNRLLVYFNGVDAPRVLSGDGTTTTTIATPPTDWSGTNQPVNGVLHHVLNTTRLIAFGNLNNPHRAYASLSTDHQDFTSAGTFQLALRSGIGDRIYGGAQYNGITFFWKYPNGIFYFDDSDLDVVNWSIRVKSEALGCAPTPYAVLALDDDVMFMSPSGAFHLLTAVDSLSGVKTSNLSRRLGLQRWLKENLNLARLNQTVSMWDSETKCAYWGVPGAGSSVNNLTLRFDFGLVDDGGPVRFEYFERDDPTAFFLLTDSDGVMRAALGEAGFIYRLEQATRSKDGIGYVSDFRTAPIDLAHIDRRLRMKKKLWEFLELMFEPVAAGSLSVQAYVDGIARGAVITMDPTKRSQRVPLKAGDGRTVEFSVTDRGNAADDFEITGMNVGVKVGDETAQETAP